MICKNCGNNIEDQATFCPYCGETVTASEPAPQQPVYEAPTQPYGMPQQPAAPAQPYGMPQQPSAPAQPYGMPQQPAYGAVHAPANAVPGKGLGITSMVLGIVSLALFCLWYLAIPCAIVAAALGGVAMSKAKQAGTKNSMAIAGVVCACIALGIAIIVLIAGASCACAVENAYDDIYSDIYYDYY